MKKINSKIETDGKLKLTSYSFEINNEHFLAHLIHGKKPKFELYHNNLLLGSSAVSENKLKFSVNSEAGILNITIWMEYSENNFENSYKENGIGIEVNGSPVQNTLADPEVYMQGGLIGLFGLLLLLLIKSIITYVVTFLEYNSHITAIFSTLLYFIPLLIVLLLIIIYQKFTKFALITGFIIAILDFVDYSVSIFIRLASGINGKFFDAFKMVIIQIIIWLPVRIYVLSSLYKAIKWWKKINEKKEEEEYKNEKSI